MLLLIGNGPMSFAQSEEPPSKPQLKPLNNPKLKPPRLQVKTEAEKKAYHQPKNKKGHILKKRAAKGKRSRPAAKKERGTEAEEYSRSRIHPWKSTREKSEKPKKKKKKAQTPLEEESALLGHEVPTTY